jgi:hypothetical protein
MKTLAYHEGIPGHHFQLAIQNELQGLPTFRTVIPFTAYIEGWALYAEQLAWEIGFQDDPLDNLGRLQAEMFRAVRLVVDTGMHDQKWTRDEAIDFFLANAPKTRLDVVNEIDRYIAWPGQALAYKIGQLKISELRARAVRKLGPKFDLRDFNDAVLAIGSVPAAIAGLVLEDLIGDVFENALIAAGFLLVTAAILTFAERVRRRRATAAFGAEAVAVESAAEMHAAAMRLAPDADVFIGCAAVSDYRAAETTTR